MSAFNFINPNTLDRIGVVAASVCAVHCIMLPLFVSALPLVGLGFLMAEQTEWTFVGLSFAAGFLSLVPSYVRRHRKGRPLILFSAGLALILIARLWLE